MPSPWNPLFRILLMKNAFRRYAAFAILAAACGVWSYGAEPAKEPTTPKVGESNPVAPKKIPQYDQMDYGPFLSASFISSPTAGYDNGPGSFNVDSTARGIII